MYMMFIYLTTCRPKRTVSYYINNNNITLQLFWINEIYYFTNRIIFFPSIVHQSEQCHVYKNH